MSRYVVNENDNGDDIEMILIYVKISTLENPEYLDSMADDVDKDIYI